MTASTRNEGARDYVLSLDEFIEIIGAIREIPRIYSSIEKMEANIQRMTQEQGRDISNIQGELSNIRSRLRKIEDAAKESPYITLTDKETEGRISQKDLLNILIRVITLIGAFGSIIYALVLGVSK